MGGKIPDFQELTLKGCSSEQISNKNDLQVMEFVKLFDPPGHARVTMTKSPQDYLKAGVDVGWTFRQFVSLRNIRKRGKRCALMYIYIYVEGTFMYRMTVLEISIYHSRIMIYDGRRF